VFRTLVSDVYGTEISKKMPKTQSPKLYVAREIATKVPPFL